MSSLLKKLGVTIAASTIVLVGAGSASAFNDTYPTVDCPQFMASECGSIATQFSKPSRVVAYTPGQDLYVDLLFVDMSRAQVARDAAMVQAKRQHAVIVRQRQIIARLRARLAH